MIGNLREIETMTQTKANKPEQQGKKLENKQKANMMILRKARQEAGTEKQKGIFNQTAKRTKRKNENQKET